MPRELVPEHISCLCVHRVLYSLQLLVSWPIKSLITTKDLQQRFNHFKTFPYECARENQILIKAVPHSQAQSRSSFHVRTFAHTYHEHPMAPPTEKCPTLNPTPSSTSPPFPPSLPKNPTSIEVAPTREKKRRERERERERSRTFEKIHYSPPHLPLSHILKTGKKFLPLLLPAQGTMRTISLHSLSLFLFPNCSTPSLPARDLLHPFPSFPLCLHWTYFFPFHPSFHTQSYCAVRAECGGGCAGGGRKTFPRNFS